MKLSEIRAAVLEAQPELELILNELDTKFGVGRTQVAKLLDQSVIEFLNSQEAAAEDLTAESALGSIIQIWRKNLANL